jgi:hypothetical protein
MNLIKSIKHQIALSVIRRWFLEGGNRFLDKDGRPVAGLNEFSKYLWEVGYRESLGFAWSRFIEGSVTVKIGKASITMHGANAMRWSVDIHIPGTGVLRARPPNFALIDERPYIVYWGPYLYLSPDGTSNAATWKWTGKRGRDAVMLRQGSR